MPNKDGTGPEGKGPKTGRQEGKCERANSCPREINRGRNGCGRGRGMSQGIRRNAN